MAKKAIQKVKKVVESAKNEGKEGYARAKQRDFIRLRNNYLTNLVNARYFTERANMIARQINEGKILENVDGCPKSKEFMVSEFALTRLRANTSWSYVRSAKEDLISQYKLQEEDFKEFEDLLYSGTKMDEIAEDDDDKAAKFVDTSEDS